MVDVTNPDPTVRSYKRRRGRMSVSKQDALRTLGPRWTVDLAALGPPPTDRSPAHGGIGHRPDGRPHPSASFGRAGAPMALDVGFGAGESTVALASAQPGVDVLAAEVHTTGIAHLLRRTAHHGLTNVRIVDADVWDVLDRLSPGALGRVQVFFPDPWPKRRHRARRLVGPAFVHAVAGRMAPGGVLHLATDSDDYAAAMLAVLAASAPFVVDHVQRRGPGTTEPPPGGRPVTTYEQRGLDAGRTVTDVLATVR